MNDGLLKAQQMEIPVNFCSDKVQNLNKRTSGRAGRSGREGGRGRQHRSMEKGVRNQASSLFENTCNGFTEDRTGNWVWKWDLWKIISL